VKKQKQCHTSHVKYPDLATTRVRPGSNDWVRTRPNLLPVPPLIMMMMMMIMRGTGSC